MTDEINPTARAAGDVLRIAAATVGERVAIVIVVDADGYMAIADICHGLRLPAKVRGHILAAGVAVNARGTPDCDFVESVRPVRG
jgi:hypothetical protein